MKDKLKIRLYRDGREVFGWVEEQNVGQQTEDDNGIVLAEIKAQCQIRRIISNDRPGFVGRALFVRGFMDARNKSYFLRKCDSEAKAIATCEDIKRLVAKANAPPADEQHEAEVVRVL